MQEAMQIELPSQLIPLPVGVFEMAEQHRRCAVALFAIAPHVIVALGAARRCEAGPLEPGMQVAGVIQHQIENHLEALAMGGLNQAMQSGQITEFWMHIGEIGDVIPAITQR